ncbi:MAG: aldolase/citrate lyase family protein [Deltaproteobacteria bacterium]|nr:aldolase/citrate lyase family protein [Deltaproteobacteria bacterium]MDZ4224366.1 aldolase/citrate lyase family protein [bacterium]
MNTLKQKLRNRERVFGAWTSIPHPGVTEMFCAIMKPDFVGIDIEHTTVGMERVQQIMTAGQPHSTALLPRVASHNGEQIKRLLDAGADGLIVPMVNSKAEVDQIVNWMKYTPVGKRSYGISRAQGYGPGFKDYIEIWNERSSLIVQIESIAAVENIDSILSSPEVDGAMIGPYDISGSLGVPGKLDHPKVLKACDHVIEACARHKKSCGNQIVDPNAENMGQFFDQGFTFLILSSDLFLLWKWCEKTYEFMEFFRGR